MKVGCAPPQTKESDRIPLPVITPRKSSISRWRALVLIAVNVLMVLHVLQWLWMGKTISPIEPSEAMHTLERGEINAGFLFFSFALLATLIVGRFVCGWGCHVLALQDACLWILKKMGVTPKPFRSKLLVYVPLVAALYMFVWPTAYRLFLSWTGSSVVAPFPGFSNHLLTEDFWATFPSLAVAIPFLFVCGFVTVYFLGSKGFCTYACPYGGFFGLLDRFSPGRIRVTDACNECGHCTAACTSNVIVHAEVKSHGMVVDPGCMKCMDCVSVCPNEALYFGYGKPAAFAKPRSTPSPRTASLSWTEEIVFSLVFLASFLATRSVYGLIPFLMALGWAGVSTFLAWKTWRLLCSQELSFYRFELKSSGRMQRAGWGLLLFSLAWLGLTAHSGWIRWHEFLGESKFSNLQIADDIVLSGEDLKKWTKPEDWQLIQAGRTHLDIADRWSTFHNPQVSSRLAWFSYLLGDAPRAVELFEKAARSQTQQARSLSLYYQGAILSRQKEWDRAIFCFDRAMALKEDFVLARMEKGDAFWQKGLVQDAIQEWKGCVEQVPSLVYAHHRLARALATMGHQKGASYHQEQAQQLTPNHPAFQQVLSTRLKILFGQ